MQHTCTIPIPRPSPFPRVTLADMVNQTPHPAALEHPQHFAPGPSRCCSGTLPVTLHLSPAPPGAGAPSSDHNEEDEGTHKILMI